MRRRAGLDRIGVVVVGYGQTVLSDRVVGVLSSVRDAVVVLNPRGATAELHPDRFPTVRCAENVGYAAAVNRGEAELDPGCSVLLVLTYDAEITADDVADLAATLLADDRCAVVGPVIRIGDQVRVGGRYLGPGRVRHSIADLPDAPTVVDWVDGAVLVIRRDVFGELGGFDEGTFMYVDEVSFCLAASDRGDVVKVDPTVVATQVPGAPNRPRAHGYLVVRNHVRLAARRGGRPGALRAALAGLSFAGRSLLRTAVGADPGRSYHLMSAAGAVDGALAGLAGRRGPPPPRVTRGSDVVLGV